MACPGALSAGQSGAVSHRRIACTPRLTPERLMSLFPLRLLCLPMAAVLVLAGMSSVPRAADASPASTAPRPNIVLILTDDEDVASHAYMPKTRALLEEQGTIFENFFVTNSF
jgi:hypothetical protein